MTVLALTQEAWATETARAVAASICDAEGYLVEDENVTEALPVARAAMVETLKRLADHMPDRAGPIERLIASIEKGAA
jgi:hypothetical protein